jgi:hypothetical protein
MFLWEGSVDEFLAIYAEFGTLLCFLNRFDNLRTAASAVVFS